MSSKRAMRQAQKQAYAKHRSNITNSRFEIKKKFLTKNKDVPNLIYVKICRITIDGTRVFHLFFLFQIYYIYFHELALALCLARRPLNTSRCFLR